MRTRVQYSPSSHSLTARELSCWSLRDEQCALSQLPGSWLVPRGWLTQLQGLCGVLAQGFVFYDFPSPSKLFRPCTARGCHESLAVSENLSASHASRASAEPPSRARLA